MLDIDILNSLNPSSNHRENTADCEITPASDSTTILEGERNNSLFKYACSLRHKGLDNRGIQSRVSDMNMERCVPPLEDAEIIAMVEGICTRYPAGDISHFDHSVFGDTLIDLDFAVLIDGTLAIWNGEKYELGEESVKRKMRSYLRNIKSAQIKEVLSYLYDMAPKVEMGSPQYIAFRNTVLDLKTMEKISNTPQLHIPNVIPHDWNPGAYSPVLDRALNDWSCGRREVRQSMEEVMGLIMYHGRNIPACPVAIGSGANGKSTYMDFLVNMLGTNNISSMDLNIIGKRFQSVGLRGMLANIGDDISNEFVKGSSAAIVKKVITGNWISAEIKSGPTFKFKPYCTLVFSCNEFPRVGDNSDGWFRRLKPIPFDANFDSGKSDTDHNLSAELDTEEAYEYAICLGVNALLHVLEQGNMTETETQKQMNEEMKLGNSPVYQFCSEVLHIGTPEEEDLDGIPTTELFNRYRKFCDEEGCRSLSRNKFTFAICRICNVERGRRTVSYLGESKQMRVFVRKNKTFP